MTVKPSEFTEETQNVLQIIDNEIVFFDYQVSDLIRSVSVNIWSCVDGEWVSVGKSYGNLASQEGRLAVRLLDGSWDIFFIDEDGTSKTSYKGAPDVEECAATAGYRLSQPVEIEPGKAITLWSVLGFDTNAVVQVTADFRDSECTAGTAATVTFSSDVVD
ncbi:MAG: hypothetical protein U0N62_08595 [Hydrogeniiclostridium sp.]